MIHTKNICPKCMKYQENLAFPCPNCGFNGTDEITGIPWEDFTILEGRYLLGTALTKKKDKICYIALDLVENKTVKIQYIGTCFEVLDPLPESVSNLSNQIPKMEQNKKKKFSSLIVLAIAVIIMVAVILHFLPLFGVTLPTGETSDDKTALQARLEELGTPMNDGSIWLPVERLDYEYQVLPVPDGTYELEPWTVSDNDVSWSYDFSKDGTVTITENSVPGSGDTFISTYDKKGHLIETETLLGGQPFSATNYSYGKDNRIQSGHVTNIVNSETGEVESGTLHYEYQNVSDGGYEVIIRSENDKQQDKDGVLTDSFYYISRYDKNENLIYAATIQVSNGEESIVHEIFYEYDDTGNITRCSGSDNFSTSPSFNDDRYSYVYNTDGNISSKVTTDDDGNVTVTEYTYDDDSNLLTEYTYADRWVYDRSTTNTFSFYIYEKFQLKNGVYVATGERTDDSIPELPKLQIPQ